MPRRHASIAASANCPARSHAWTGTGEHARTPSSRSGPNSRRSCSSTPDCKPRLFLPTCNDASPAALRTVNCGPCSGGSRAGGAESGPAKEVFFAQVHHPGRLAASDFTHCTDLGVTMHGSPFDHLIYHFVLTYSNWETGTICFSESLESLSEGLQNALWELGGVPQLHRTDRLTAAVQPGVEGPESFKQRYQALLQHYGLQGQAIQAGKGNENGDAEQSHHQFKRAVDQALMMRGSRDFSSRDSYLGFPAASVRAAKCRPRRPSGGGSGVAATVAASATGNVQAAAGACGTGQHHQSAGERLLGGQPADRRDGWRPVCTPRWLRCGTPRSSNVIRSSYNSR